MLVTALRALAVGNKLDPVLPVKQRVFNLLFLEVNPQRREIAGFLLGSEFAANAKIDVEYVLSPIRIRVSKNSRMFYLFSAFAHDRPEWPLDRYRDDRVFIE